MANVAKDIIWPLDIDILVRVVVLHVGQGASAVVLVASGDSYKTILIDTNLDSKSDGIDVPRLMVDLLEDKGNCLDIFVNTHPHSDHLSGIVELSKALAIQEVWHSGHKPGKEHEEAYKDLENLIKKVKDAGGAETKLKGSRTSKQIGDAEYHVLAPAQYVTDDIEGESPDERYRRIHEQCAVLKFGVGDTWIMMAGDADRDAWEKHITNYHSERLPSIILEAAHHGSRTFFRYSENDEPYLDALERISPTYVVISAPRSDESQCGHPHPDAVELYADAVGLDNILHTGDQRHSFICDIFRDEECVIQSDNGDLAEAYPIADDQDDDNGHSERKFQATPVVGTRVDHRPMGCC